MTTTRLQFFNEYWAGVNETNRRSGGRVLDLGMGMPPPELFETPRVLVERLHESIDAGDYHLYVPPEGAADCLAEIVEHENAALPAGARRYTLDNVMLVPGGIQAFALVLSELVAKDDQVLVPTPSYFSLSALSELRARTITVPGDLAHNFQAHEVRAAFTNAERARLVWFCQPNNPTGLYLPATTAQEVIDVAKQHDAYVVLDESCDNYRFGANPVLPGNITDPHVIRIRTFSKDPNFAGYRVGYFLGSAHILERFKTIAPIMYGNPTVMATRAITADFMIKNGKLVDADYARTTTDNLAAMTRARDFLYAQLKAWSRVEDVILPDACYYMFVQFDFAAGSRVLCHRLLADELLNVVPGTVFGVPERAAWVRICFARSLDTLSDAIGRIRRVIER